VFLLKCEVFHCKSHLSELLRKKRNRTGNSDLVHGPVPSVMAWPQWLTAEMGLFLCPRQAHPYPRAMGLDDV